MKCLILICLVIGGYCHPLSVVQFGQPGYIPGSAIVARGFADTYSAHIPQFLSPPVYSETVNGLNNIASAPTFRNVVNYNNLIPEPVTQLIPVPVKPHISAQETIPIREETIFNDAPTIVQPTIVVRKSEPIFPPPTPIISQYHMQDELGQYSYGYSGDTSSKQETKTADGVVRGSYSYIDPNGEVQSVHYIADDIHGFRVAATNLPEAPLPTH